MPASHAPVVIVGAGAAGLACRMALSGQREVICLEAAEEIGGLLRMHTFGAHSFDTTVHVLFFRNVGTRALVESLLPEGFHAFRKRNLVWQRERVIDYPYQFNAHALEPDVRDACLSEFPVTVPDARVSDKQSFEAWLLGQFGSGFYRHFFESYNRKLYGVPPSQLEAAPMIWTIPADNQTSVLRGATGPSGAGMPAVECLYPKGRAGIHAIPQRLAERGTGAVLCGETVASVDLDTRTVTTARGLEFHYAALVSTIPLPALLRCARGLPEPVAGWAEVLEARAVTILRVAIENDGGGLDAHWTYFPDPEIPFYRLTRLERISPDLAPLGSAACLLEYGGAEEPDEGTAVELCRRLGVAGPGRVVCAGSTTIPCAYVLFKHGHREAAARAIDHLAGRGVFAAGRYGAWEYANIDQTIESGLRAARGALAYLGGA